MGGGGEPPQKEGGIRPAPLLRGAVAVKPTGRKGGDIIVVVIFALPSPCGEVAKIATPCARDCMKAARPFCAERSEAAPPPARAGEAQFLQARMSEVRDRRRANEETFCAKTGLS